MNRQIFSYCAIVGSLWGFGLADVSLANELETEAAKITVTPLAEQLFTQPTAKQLQQGELILNFDNRLFFLPDLVPGAVDDDSDSTGGDTEDLPADESAGNEP